MKNYKIAKEGEVNNLKMEIHKMTTNLDMAIKEKNNISI